MKGTFATSRLSTNVRPGTGSLHAFPKLFAPRATRPEVDLGEANPMGAISSEWPPNWSLATYEVRFSTSLYPPLTSPPTPFYPSSSARVALGLGEIQ